MINATAATTASSIPIARTDTTQPTPLQQTAPINIPRLYSVGVETSRSFPNAAPASPRSQLRALAGAGDGTAIKRLLAHSKPDLNTPDPATGLTALMLAASQGHDDVVFLLAKGMEAQDTHRETMQGDSALALGQHPVMPMSWCSCYPKVRSSRTRTGRWQARLKPGKLR